MEPNFYLDFDIRTSNLPRMCEIHETRAKLSGVSKMNRIEYLQPLEINVNAFMRNKLINLFLTLAYECNVINELITFVFTSLLRTTTQKRDTSTCCKIEMLGTGFVVVTVCLGVGIVVMIALLVKEVKDLEKMKEGGTKKKGGYMVLPHGHFQPIVFPP